METLLNVIIPLVAIPTVFMLMLRAYFEMQTARIKCNSAKIESVSDEKEVEKEQNEKETVSYVTAFDRSVLVILSVLALLSFAYGAIIDVAFLIMFVGFIFLLGFWFLYVWMSALTKMFGEVKEKLKIHHDLEEKRKN